MQVCDFVNIIEKTAPLQHAAAWDNSGMQVASSRHIETVAICLDPSPHSVRQALEQGADFVLSHHPLLMKPRLPKDLDAYHEALRLLFRHDAGLYAAHTSLDTNLNGPAGWLARELGLVNCTPLEPVPSLPDVDFPVGYGFVGDFPQPLSYADLRDQLRTMLPLEGAQRCGPLPQKISRLACCPGSGASLLDFAVQARADLYLTGDVKYHTALETEIAILDVGHHSIEEEMMRRFADFLKQTLPLHCIFIPSQSPFYPLTAE